ncbi:hypothetical protein [Flavobacterium sp.]|jgi:hypothetical protein|uniref:hypothetical protein n=1 Tax=Flavobacterium sp. TaxID=239 RepID=UPI0022BD93ED|nr:hypothetical protein [Flavobacterium sp.]MCZ8145168.1 hypothetical protein [Flavobacterium sp.]MCZ8366448.1 hypothetical protein [Flavobacterium sp.]
MKTNFLFPNSWKMVGWLLFIPGIMLVLVGSFLNVSLDDFLQTKVLALYSDPILGTSGWFTWVENGIADELLTVMVIGDGLLVGFSKTKNEDEMISSLRYESLVWATYLNYGIILFTTLFVFGVAYMNVLIHNLFTLLFFFILRFHYRIYKVSKSADYEE